MIVSQKSVAELSASEPVPNEIWDSLAEEFSLNEPAASDHIPITSQDDHPLLEAPERILNSSDPLSQLDCEVNLCQLQQQQTDPIALFNADVAFQSYQVLADNTPSVLLGSHSSPMDCIVTPVKNLEQDALALFRSSSVLVSRDVSKGGLHQIQLDGIVKPYFQAHSQLEPVPSSILDDQEDDFMPSNSVPRDVFCDLLTPQLGKVEEICTVIASILQSLNPQHLEEGALKEGVALHDNRGAALWSYFETYYQNIAEQIGADIRRLLDEKLLDRDT